MSVAVLDRSAARIGHSAAVLAAIIVPATQLAVWQRPRPAVLSWADALDACSVDDLDLPIAVDRLAADVPVALATGGYPTDERGRAIAAAIVALAQQVAEITGCGSLKIRLEIVEHDACRRFPMDMQTVRLLTTFHGPGTQWIECDASERAHQLAADDVALLKGRDWMHEPRILHRSPPVSASRETRLLLVIDSLEQSRQSAVDPKFAGRSEAVTMVAAVGRAG